MRNAIFDQLATLVLRYPGPIVIAAFVLAMAGAIYARGNLQLHADTNELIAADRPFMAGFDQFVREFGDLEYIHVVVDSKGRPERAEACVDLLTRRLRALPDLPAVASVIDPREQLRLATRSMPASKLAELAQAREAFSALMSPGGPTHVLAQAERFLDEVANPDVTLTPEMRRLRGGAGLFLLGVLASAREEARTRDQFASLRFDTQRPRYLVSETGRLYFVQILPVKDYGTLGVVERPLHQIRDVIAQTREDFPDLAIGLTGKPVLQADEMATTEQDMRMAAFIAVGLVSLLFIVIIRGVRRPLLAVATFGCALAWTFGVVTLLYGQLNLLSIVFIVVLIGVGLDYGVHVVARHREFRFQHGIEETTRGVMRTAVRGNLTGVLASSAVFLMAVFTGFGGLRELGVIAGVGLLLCCLAMTFVLPSLLVLTERRRPLRPSGRTPRPMHDTFRFLNIAIERPGLVIAILVGLSLLSSPLVLRLEYEKNLLNLQADGLESVQWQRRLAEDSASATWFGAVIADDLTEVESIVERARLQPMIGKIRSVLDVIASPSEARLALRSELPAADEVGQPLETLTGADEDRPSCEDLAFSPADLQDVTRKVQRLSALAGVTAPEQAEFLRALMLDLNDLLRAIVLEQREGHAEGEHSIWDGIDEHVRQIARSVGYILGGNGLPLRESLPAAVRGQMMSPGGRFLVMLHPREDVWEFESMRAFIGEMREVDPAVTGVPITHYESMVDMRNAFGTMTLLASIAVVIILFSSFRDASMVILTLIPVALAVLWTVVIMGLTGVSFSLANFFAIPILVGLSADASIHIMHRYREGGPHHLDLGATRQAVILTGGTTMVGFGCLALAHHRGLQSLGFAIMIGTACGLVATVVMLPALLAWVERLRGGRPLGVR